MTNTICQLYTGSTAKGSNSTITSTSSGGSLINLTPGNWTRSELNNLRMRIGATSSSSTSSKYVYIYGTDITVSYESEGELYFYTISNITTDHTVLITTGQTISVTGVSLNQNTATISAEETI
ncbi:MAG: hypothetical protein LIR50_06890 [Bacillota bacterium]|nr:hypothetical protein [Bacillota bacterium]